VTVKDLQSETAYSIRFYAENIYGDQAFKTKDLDFSTAVPKKPIRISFGFKTTLTNEE